MRPCRKHDHVHELLYAVVGVTQGVIAAQRTLGRTDTVPVSSICSKVNDLAAGGRDGFPWPNGQTANES